MKDLLCQTVPKSLFFMLSKVVTLTFIFVLAYTTTTNLFLLLNLNYKILIKCVDLSKFLSKNLIYEKFKNFLIPSPDTISTLTRKLIKCLNPPTFYATNNASMFPLKICVFNIYRIFKSDIIWHFIICINPNLNIPNFLMPIIFFNLF